MSANTPWLIFGWGSLIFLFGYAFLILWRAASGKFDPEELISEPDPPAGNGKASLSRFQGLLFTFIVAAGIVAHVTVSKKFDDLVIPDSLLYLMGGSALTFLASKGVSASAANKANGGLQQSDDAAAAPAAPPAPPVLSGLINGLGLIIGGGIGSLIQRFSDPQNIAGDQRANPTAISATAASGAGAFGPWLPVAAVVGRATLQLTEQHDAAATGFNGEVRMRQQDGTSGIPQSFVGQASVTTPAGAITTVEVHFQARSSGAVIISGTVNL